MANYLVTGGAGHIGSTLVDRLIADGNSCTVVDNMTTGKRENLNPEARFFTGIPEMLRSIEEQFDGVFHLASTVGVDRVMEAPGLSTWNIVNSAFEAARFVMCHQDRKPRFVLASSSEVYGHASGMIGESTRCAIPSGPRWSYAAAKLATETITTDVIAARIFNTIGPRQTESFVVPRFIHQALTGEPIVKFNNLSSRSYADVEDTVSGLITLMLKGTPGEIYNIGVRNLISTTGLADLVKSVTGSSSPIILNSSCDRAQEDIFERIPGTTKLESLGWRPQYLGLREIILRIVVAKRAQLNLKSPSLVEG